MQVQHEQENGKGAFYFEIKNKRLAEMTYTMPAPGKMIIDHTEVSDELRGQKAGFQLVQSAVEYARNHQLTIIPLCPFAHSVFKKTPGFQDVLSGH